MPLAGVSLSVSISVMEIALGLLLVFLIVRLYVNRTDITTDCPYFIPFFVYWLATVVSLFAGSDAANISGGVFSIWGLLYFFVGYYLITASNIRLTIAALAFGGVLLGISTIADAVIYGSARPDGFLRMYMTTGEILAMGAVSALGVIITRYEKGLTVLFYVVAFLIMAAGMCLTGTRGAFLSFIVSASLMLVIRFRLKGVLAAIALIFIMSFVAFFTSMAERFAEISQAGIINAGTSHGWRFVLWLASFELIKEYPLFGIGYGAFQPMVMNFLPSGGMSTAHPHNAYINQLVIYGIVGFASFCYLYGKITYDLLKQILINNYAFIGFFVMLSFFVAGITENNFTDGEVKMFQMFFVGCMLGAIRGGFKER